jgi:hypothetical protein
LKIAVIDRFSYNPLKIPDFLNDFSSDDEGTYSDLSSKKSFFQSHSTKSINSKKNSISIINDLNSPIRKNSNSSVIIQNKNSYNPFNCELTYNAKYIKYNKKQSNNNIPFWKNDNTFSYNNFLSKKKILTNIYLDKEAKFSHKAFSGNKLNSDKINSFNESSCNNKERLDNYQSQSAKSSYASTCASKFDQYNDLFSITISRMFNDFT